MKPRLIVAVCALAAVVSAAPMWAAERTLAPGAEDAEGLAREGVEKLLRALELLLQSIPQYEAPVINENGDIIIRRRNPRPERGPDREPPMVPEEPVETRT